MLQSINIYPWVIDVDALNHVYVSGFINNYIQVFAPIVPPPPPDIVPPTLTFVPEDIVVEAETATGTVVTFPDPIAVDDRDTNIILTREPTSGSLFPVQITQVERTATDLSGNTAKATFKTTVQDTTPSSFVSLPSDIVVEATGSDVTVVSYLAVAEIT